VVGTAGDGEAALALILEQQPDVILTDLHMPVLNGLGLVRRVMAQMPRPIIVVSVSVADDGARGSANAFELLGAGAVDVYPKPRAGFSRSSAPAYRSWRGASASPPG
jgi:two-component system chemotaxis response regulator CheB